VLPDGWTQSEPAGGAPYVIAVDRQNPTPPQSHNFGTHVIAPPSVVDRQLFYYKSPLGGPAILDPANDRAIATDKAALLPGERASFSNVSSYSRGVNGVMIDLNDANRSGSISYFRFAVGDGTSQAPNAWTAINPLASLQVRRGAGVGGSDRFIAVFADNVVANKWLRVTVDPGQGSGLAAPDVFYFGSLIGETGDTLSPFRLSAADLGAIKKVLNTSVGPTSRFDFNRDGLVNALDLGIAKANLNRSLPQLAPPGAAAGPFTLRDNATALLDRDGDPTFIVG
jgi:hypothetical protein